MITRRTALGSLGAIGAGMTVVPAASAADAAAPGKRRRLAIVTTAWRYRSHAWHTGERFLVGYPINGRWHRPPVDVVSA